MLVRLFKIKPYNFRRVFLTFVSLFCLAFTSFSQIEEADSSEMDSLEFDEFSIDNSVSEITKLWDTSKIGIIALPGSERQNLCLYLTDDLHCCFEAPCRGKVTSNFGWRHGRIHTGIDIDLETGDPVHAAFDGIIRQAGWNNGYGYYVIISHFNGLETLYGHLSSLKTNTLQPVKFGQVIGLGGNTGRSRGSHLHFEVRYFGKPVNPKLLINFNDYSLTTDSIMLGHASTFSKSNYINEMSSLLVVMNDSTYAKKEAEYELKRQKIQKKKEKLRRESERKRKEKAAKKEKERLKNAKSLTHKIKSGDTLSSLARKYGTTVAKLCKLNKMQPTDILDLGRKLKVK